MAQTLYAYKGFVYKIEAEELVIVDRYMMFRDSGEKIGLNEFGEITLDDFRQIVDSYLNRNEP
jgi:hypothetical protein